MLSDTTSMTTFPFDNSKIDWELIASSVHWYKGNGAQMERAFASLLFEQGISHQVDSFDMLVTRRLELTFVSMVQM